MAPKPTKALHQTTLETFLSSPRTIDGAGESSRSGPSSALTRPKHLSYPSPSGRKPPPSQRLPKPDANVAEDLDSDSSGVESIRFESVAQKSKPRSQRAIVLSDGEDSPPRARPPSLEPRDEEIPSPRKVRTAFGSVARPRAIPTANRLPSTPPSSGASSPLTQSSIENLEELPLPSHNTKGKLVIDSDEEERPPRKKTRLGLKRFDAEEDEMKQIRDEIDPDLIISDTTRARTGTKRAAFAKHLERLKRKRMHTSAHSSSQESGSVQDDHQSPDEDEETTAPFKNARPHRSSDDEDLDEHVPVRDEGDGFIVEDDQDDVQVDLPDAFNMSSHQDAAHHFKVICQLFVHLIVAAGDDTDARHNLLATSYFRTALTALRRSIDSTRDSLVASSVWRPDFRHNLESKPNLFIERLDETVSGCDACHIGTRISTLRAQLDGSQWAGLDQASVPDVDDDENPGTVVYHVGRFCASRMRVYHDFAHWEDRLYTALEEQIAFLHPAEEEADGRNSKRMFRHVDEPENLDSADDIMDWLDKKGVINFEWLQLKQVMESATGLQVMTDEDTLG